MNYKITLKVSFLFFVLLLCCSISAQKKPMQVQGQDQFVFGKTYTIDDLKKMNGVIRCASTEYEAMLQKQDPNRMTDAQFEAWIAPLIENSKTSKSQNNGVITIPVVVHVIHSGQAYGVDQNISDEQVQSQITVMNNDFRRMMGTPGFNSNPVGADIMIQFALAKVDPNGNPTNGIDRVNMCQNSWTTGQVDTTVKPATIWNPTQYMNMWSVKFGGSSANILGYAQFPSNSGVVGVPAGGAANTDGVVANYGTFGSSDYGTTFTLDAPYDKGRTMTHEVGHFLGLRHIWGDDDATDPNGLSCATDYCNDTPPAHQANGSCVTPIASCTSGLFEMVENYMDYTNDTCMNIFTLDQKARMTAVMNNSPRRVELKTSVKDVAIPLFANDAELKAEKICSTSSSCNGTALVSVPFSLYNRGTSVLTSAVITYSVNGGASQTYNWTGNLAQNKYAIVPITATENSTVSAQITSVNGTSDARVSNNTAFSVAGNYTATPVGSTSVTFTLQPDFYGSETTWTLKNSAGATLYSGGPYADGVAIGNQIQSLPALVTQTWNLTPDCYTFTINDSDGDGITVYGYYNVKNSAGSTIISEGSTNFGATQSKAFKVLVLSTNEANGVGKNDIQIYPNPVSDILNIIKVSDKATYKIYSAAGQLVKQGNISGGQINVSELIKGGYVITIEEKGKEAFNSKFIKK
ncbi:M43 family zinc metalloprotease [uncultured Chryseobacterium sp.]|uniref:M43 family zinc metalloprotease n=1 Tax=uncultured Chryseobacterium sp. TaxID=259322 RepID=UPI0025EE9D3A|nr:M43 family zinc metalloprotease [uncultured Chryseobacterium sp.]